MTDPRSLDDGAQGRPIRQPDPRHAFKRDCQTLFIVSAYRPCCDQARLPAWRKRASWIRHMMRVFLHVIGVVVASIAMAMGTADAVSSSARGSQPSASRPHSLPSHTPHRPRCRNRNSLALPKHATRFCKRRHARPSPPLPPAVPAPTAPPTPGPPSNPIVAENAKPGSALWRIPWVGYTRSSAADEIAGYPAATSVAVHESLDFKVTTNPQGPFDVDVFRLGWYAGAGGRLIAHLGSFRGVTQPTCASPGLTSELARECLWSTSFSLSITTDYASGVYVAILTNQSKRQVSVPFVVRDDTRSAALLYVSPFITYEAYNNYPNDAASGQSRPASGQNLYPDTSAATAQAPAGQPAVRVSFDRPFAWPAGIGQFDSFEPALIEFLERNGYDVSYVADTDLNADPTLLKRHRGIVLSSHPEYWTRTMFDGLRSARDAGVNIASIAANALYWPVRLESTTAGTASRIIVAYKAVRPDPIGASNPSLRTDRRFRDLGIPEQQLLGNQYVGSSHITAGGQSITPINTTHWAFAGTGIVEGLPIPGEIAGYEINVIDPTAGTPSNTSFTQLTRSLFHANDGKTYTQATTIYRAPSGAWVFDTGSMAWAWTLTHGFGATNTDNYNPQIERMTLNVLNVISGNDPPPN